MFDSVETTKKDYESFLVKGNEDASKCVECGACEEKCPQHINIIEKLKEVKETFNV
jgi:predicted aldo/keto reductase-like oxidoreductase